MLLPGLFVLGITTWSISSHAVRGLAALRSEGLSTEGINGILAVALLALSVTFGVEALRVLRAPRKTSSAGAPS